jgi:hypothetical protein
MINDVGSAASRRTANLERRAFKASDLRLFIASLPRVINFE